MKLSTMLKSALALGLGFVVGTGYAADESKYTEDFEGYEVGTPINTEHSDPDPTVGFGWYSGEEDQSKVAEGKVLKLNTESDTLTNKFDSATVGALNTAIAADGAYFEMDVKFVASDSLDAGITGGTDDAKFALYAYYNEDADPPYTNLVVFHAYYDSEFNMLYTNDVTDIAINTEVLTHVRIDMTQVDDQGNMLNAFTVTVGTGTDAKVVTTANAYDSDLGSKIGSLFLTAEDWNDTDAQAVSALTFKGTGDIDNIAVGTVSAAPKNTVILLAGDTQKGTYATLASAFAAAADGDTVKLLADQAVDAPAENNNDVTLDLGGFTVTVADGYTGYILDNEDGTLVISNGTLSAAYVLAANGGTVDLEDGAVVNVTHWEGFCFKNDSDGIIGTNAVVSGSGAFDGELPPIGFIRYGTGKVDVYGTVTHVSESSAAIYMDSKDATINVYDGAIVTGASDAIRPDHGTLNVYGGTLTGGGNFPTIYVWDSANSIVNIYGGDIVSLNAGGEGEGNPPAAIGVGATTVCVLNDTCKARFKGINDITDWAVFGVRSLCAPGYVPVLGQDGWYTIQQVHTVTLINGEFAVDTQVVADGQFATNVVLDVAGFKGWTNETYTAAFDFATTAITADITLYAWIEASAQGFNYPEGDAIATDSALYAWLVANGATQEAINALGSKAALMEKYLLNLALADSSYELKVSSIAVGETVDVAVTLIRENALEGGINGTLKLHGAATLGADGEFAEVTGAEFVNGDFAKEGPAATSFTAGEAKFFKAVIE